MLLSFYSSISGNGGGCYTTVSRFISGHLVYIHAYTHQTSATITTTTTSFFLFFAASRRRCFLLRPAIYVAKIRT